MEVKTPCNGCASPASVLLTWLTSMGQKRYVCCDSCAREVTTKYPKINDSLTIKPVSSGVCK